MKAVKTQALVCSKNCWIRNLFPLLHDNGNVANNQTYTVTGLFNTNLLDDLIK
jgi:hypothetical protein